MKSSKPNAKNLRKGRFSEANRIYMITTVCSERIPYFEDFKTARILIHTMMGHEKYHFAETLSFIIMPDHLHWLMQLGDAKDLSETVGSLKAITSKKIGKSIFQNGFYDHAVRKEEDIKELARYIVANPLRAGLVEDINDYPHWDAVWM